MTTDGMQNLLFRHVEKFVLALVALFVFYQTYTTLFPPEVTQAPLPGTGGPPPEKPSLAIPAGFSETAAPFVTVPPVEKAKYPWFHPPVTRALRRVELVDQDEPVERRSLGMRRRIKREGDRHKAPIIREVPEAERALKGLPPPPDNLTERCEVKIDVEPGDPGGTQGDTLVFTAVKPGYWIEAIFTLEDEDRVSVAIQVRKAGERGEYVLATGTIQEIKEDPRELGTVIIRFTAPEGSVKSKDGRMTTTYIEPARYELVRKGEGDDAETVVKTLDGRFMRPADAAPGAEPKASPKGTEPAGLPPGAPRDTKAKREPAPAPKATRPEDIGGMVFTDSDVEAEAKYTYRVRSVPRPEQAEELKLKVEYGPPKDYTTLPRFDFAYVGGDANRAKIIVYIGPRKHEPEKTGEPERRVEARLFEGIPIGGWVGDVPKEFRSQAPATEPPRGAAAPPVEGAPTATKAEEAAASRYVTRHILVDIEQNVFRPDEYTVRLPLPPDALGRPQFKDIVAYRETVDRRAIILDTKRNKLRYLWHDRQATLPGPAGKEAPGKR